MTHKQLAEKLIERCAKEAEVCAHIYAKSGGRKSQRLTKCGAALGVAMRIRELLKQEKWGLQDRTAKAKAE